MGPISVIPTVSRARMSIQTASQQKENVLLSPTFPHDHDAREDHPSQLPVTPADEKIPQQGPTTATVYIDHDGRFIDKLPSEQRKLMWKIDTHVLPWIAILYFLAFLDRVNIGNARLFGLEADTRLVGNQYNIALLLFFVPYILLEVPSNLILKKVRPRIWLPCNPPPAPAPC